MNIKAKTKLIDNSGSLRTTVPKKIAELLNLNDEKCILWNLEITEKGPILTITPFEKENKS